MVKCIFITLSVLAGSAMGQEIVSERVNRGDSLAEVTQRLGTPMLEYPVNNQWVHEYEDCTLVSSNGTVLSVEYKIQENIAKQPVKEDDQPTIQEIKEKAMQGDAEAQYLLAYCFQFGNVVEQNYDTAVAWYTRSAMQGYMPSQHNLGFLYMKGKGVEKDFVQAYMWALLAAQNGNDTLMRALKYKVTDGQAQAATLRAEQIQARMQAENPTATP